MKIQSRRHQNILLTNLVLSKALKFAHTLTKQFHFWKFILKNKTKQKNKDPSSIQYKKLEIT